MLAAIIGGNNMDSGFPEESTSKDVGFCIYVYYAIE